MKNRRMVLILSLIILLACVSGCKKKVDTDDTHADSFNKISLNGGAEQETKEKTFADQLMEEQQKILDDAVTKQEVQYVTDYIADPIDIESAEEDDDCPLIIYEINRKRLDTIDNSNLPDDIFETFTQYNMRYYNVLSSALIDICNFNEIEIDSVTVPKYPFSYTDDYEWDTISFNIPSGKLVLYVGFEPFDSANDAIEETTKQAEIIVHSTEESVEKTTNEFETVTPEATTDEIENETSGNTIEIDGIEFEIEEENDDTSDLKLMYQIIKK